MTAAPLDPRDPRRRDRRPGPAATRPDGRPRIAVIGGGPSSEHDVSLGSAAAVVAGLDPARYDAVPLTLRRDLAWTDASGAVLALADAVGVLAGCDAVIPMLHGRLGEDGTIAALCDLADVPYVGSGVRAGAIGMDKHATKLLARSVGIDVAPGVLLTAATAGAFAWERPVVVKPASGGSSHGVGLALGPDDLPGALADALALDDRILVEELVAGREIDVPVIRAADGTLRIGPAVEIVAEGLFDAGTKYGGRAEFRIPAPLAPSERAALEDAAGRMAEALDCRGVARIDFFLTAAGPVLNEVNTAPGFTPSSQVPRAFAADGLAFPDLVELLLRDVLADGRSAPREEACGRPRTSTRGRL